MSRRTTQFIRILAVILMIAAWLAIGMVGGQKLGSLSALQKNDSASFLPASAESTKVSTLLPQFSGAKTLPLVVVVERAEGLRATDLDLLKTLPDKLANSTAAIGSDQKLSDFVSKEKIATVPSDDGKAAMVVISLDADLVGKTSGKTSIFRPIVKSVNSVVDEVLSPAGLTHKSTGPAGFISDLGNAFSGIDGLLLIVALVVVLVILLVVYRSPILPIAVLATAILGLSAAGFVVHALATKGWITISGQSQGILSILVVGAATDYALLLVSRYKEELHRDENPFHALTTAWKASLGPILASGLTVMLGLICLVFAELKGTAGLGPVGAVGIGCALVAALTFLPAFLVLGRRWIFWPMIPKLDHRQDVSMTAKLGFAWVTRLVSAKPRWVWTVTALVLAAGAACLPMLKTQGIGQHDLFLKPVAFVEGQKIISAHFPGGVTNPVQIVTPKDQAMQVLTKLKSAEGVTGPRSAAKPGQAPKEIDGKVLLQATLTDEVDSERAAKTVRELRTSLHQISPDILVGGETAQLVDTRTSAMDDLIKIIPMIIIVVFVVLAILLRAVVASLMLIIVNVLSFGATMGISALVFNYLFGFKSGDPTTLLYGFVFLVALGVDYSIFLMTRAREEAAVVGTRQGVLKALAVTGGVITSAGLVLAATFGALSVVPVLFLAQISFIVGFGVLLDTFVVRSLLVPALSLEIGKKVWWPSRPDDHVIATKVV